MRADENIFGDFICQILGCLHLSKNDFVKELHDISPETDDSTIWKWFSNTQFPRSENIKTLTKYFITKFSSIKKNDYHKIRNILINRIKLYGIRGDNFIDSTPEDFIKSFIPKLISEMKKMKKLGRETYIDEINSPVTDINSNKTLAQDLNFKINFFKCFASNFHIITHTVRDGQYNLMSLKRKSAIDLMNYSVETSSQVLVESFTRIMELILTDKFNISIKLFDLNSLTSTDYKLWEVVTLCFSQKFSKKEKERFTAATYIEYEFILSNEGPIFAEVDLLNTKKKICGIEKNFYLSEEEAMLSEYNSKVVVPIRIDSRKKHNLSSLKSKIGLYEILGFVCIDFCCNLNDRNEDLLEAIVKLTSSFSDELFKYFEKYLFYQMQKNQKSITT